MIETPIPMLLVCPACGDRHIDEGEFATKVHATHACQTCGTVWRPAIVATVGVRFLPGFKNAQPAPLSSHPARAQSRWPNDTSPERAELNRVADLLVNDINDRSTAKNWWTFTAWTHDGRIADCGVVFGTTAETAERVAHLCIGGPLASKVTRVEVGNLAARTGLK